MRHPYQSMDVFIPLLLLVSIFPAQVESSDFSVTVWGDGFYTVDVGDAAWLYGGDTYFHADGRHYSTADKTLLLAAGPSYTKGSDVFGSWVSAKYTWNVGPENQVDTVVNKYEDVNLALFSQRFHGGLRNTAVGNKNKTISGFPAFKTSISDAKLGFMAYSGLFIGWMNMEYGKWTTTMRPRDGLDSGPLVVFDTEGHVMVISPFSQFMAASYTHDAQQNVISWGIMGDVETIPAGFEYTTMVFYSDKGINKAMEEWGALLQKWYGRSTAARQLDPSINYIGYYTDNGAYYYHHTEPAMNYEKTIATVVEAVKKQNIPYRYIQLDDWWYPVKGPGYGATITWTADPTVFPHGLQYVYNMTQWPVVAHNRYWSNVTPYAKKNNGTYNFLFDGKLSLPDDQSFWDYLLRTAKEWGLIVYEQDWLNYQVNNFAPLHSDVSLGRRWLQQMGEAASRFGLQIQYCMAQPRHLLASLEVPTVSQIRASIDYQLRDNQWEIGVTSIFANALGVAPFKDNFWTVTKQPGNPYKKTEPNPLLQATVALLSTGPVGVSDRAGYTDKNLVNRLINADGLLLKPSKPATAIDAQILQKAFGAGGPVGEVWSTNSMISNMFHGIIFSPEINKTFYIGPQEAGFVKGSYMVYSYQYQPASDVPVPFDDAHSLSLSNCTHHDFCLYYASPVLTWNKKQLVILGELSKLVPVSPQRVASIEYGTQDILITLKGKPLEIVNFYVYANGQNLLFKCQISGSGTSTISMYTNQCH